MRRRSSRALAAPIRLPAESTRFAPRSRTLTPTTTVRSCRSGWPRAGGVAIKVGAATEVELKERAPHRGRRPQRQGGCRGRHRRRWWRRARSGWGQGVQGPQAGGRRGCGRPDREGGSGGAAEADCDQRRPRGWVVAEKVKGLPADHGLNAATGVYENLLDAGVPDPTKVTCSALQNAARSQVCS